MEHQNNSTHRRKGKHLNHTERIQIETLFKSGQSTSRIAEIIGRHPSTIRREKIKGTILRLNSDSSRSEVYNADRAQDLHDLAAESKGPNIKLKTGSTANQFIIQHLVEKRYSPEAIAALMKQQNIQGAVCAKTLYTYIEKGWIQGVTNETLWEKRKRGKKQKRLVRRAKRACAPGHGIADRPASVEDREELGHWEGDLIVSGSGCGNGALLTLLERKSRWLIVRKIKDKTQASVQRALNAIERSSGGAKFREMFKSITLDNGSEFLDFEGLERSVFSSTTMRTRIYYARPYASWERGSNENVNRMIRRFIPKGSDISRQTHSRISEIEEWINTYPRKVLGFQTAQEAFGAHMA